MAVGGWAPHTTNFEGEGGSEKGRRKGTYESIRNGAAELGRSRKAGDSRAPKEGGNMGHGDGLKRGL